MSQTRRMMLAIIMPFIIVGVPTAIVLLIHLPRDAVPVPPDLPEVPCPTESPDDPVNHPSVLSEHAAPYTGAGPHPILLDTLVDGAAVLPDSWKPPRAYGAYAQGHYEYPVDYARTQLVICDYMITVGKQEIDRCQYPNNKSYRLLEATHTLLVFEAKTSRLVQRFDLPGRTGCPPEVSYFEGMEPQFLAQDYLSSELEMILRPLVENPL
jgi:hypothetical protein